MGVTTEVSVRREKRNWTVNLTDGELRVVKASRHLVTEHGHLEFDTGAVFARNAWQSVVPGKPK